MTHQHETEPADLCLCQRLRHHGVGAAAGIKGHAIVGKDQHDRVWAGLQGDLHIGFAAVARAMADDVGDDLLEYELGVVACRPFESFGIERCTQTLEAAREARMCAGETDLDARRRRGTIRLRGREAQVRTTATAAVASERTGTI